MKKLLVVLLAIFLTSCNPIPNTGDKLTCDSYATQDNVEKFILIINDEEPVYSEAITVDDGTTLYYDLYEIQEGINYLIIRAVDKDGNESGSSYVDIEKICQGLRCSYKILDQGVV